MPVEYLTLAIEDRALEVQLLLADRRRHRAPSIPDLLIAATAELAGLTVLHLDKNIVLIAEVTGQHTERLRARGPRPPRGVMFRAHADVRTCGGERRRRPGRSPVSREVSRRIRSRCRSTSSCGPGESSRAAGRRPGRRGCRDG